MAKQSEGTQAQDDLAVSCYNLGTLDGMDAGERRAFLEKALGIWTKLSRETSLPEYKRRADIAQSALDSLEAPSAEVNRIPLSSDVSVPASGGRKKTPLGWLLVLLMAVIAAGAAVQLTGAFDLLGWLRGLFG